MSKRVMGKKDNKNRSDFFQSLRDFIAQSSDTFLSPLFNERTKIVRQLNRVLTPLDQAVAEIHRRRQDPALLAEVQNYLRGDIPEHFHRNDPVMYLCRHIATPNHETLRFVELAKPHGLPIVIGQDTEDLFVSNNILKRNLGKMPIVKGVARNGDEIIENFTIVDFHKHQGQKLKHVQTKFGEDLTRFHNSLFREVYPHEVELVDESDWVSRNYRGYLYEHYTRLLALLVVHGIMFEYYEPEDDEFVNDILTPSFKKVESNFGLKPLIVNLVDSEIELKTDWNGYPSVIYQQVKRILTEKGPNDS